MLFVILFIAACVSATSGFSCEDAFPDYPTTSWGDNCYVFDPQALTYSQSRDFCESLGGELTSIHSAEENQIVYELAANNWNGFSGHSIWLGGKDVSVEGNFEWDDGTPWDYVNWNVGEPNQAGGNEDYINMYITILSGLWNDIQDGVGYVNEMAPMCKIPTCLNYDGEYIAGFAQCGFDDTQFVGDYEEIDSIDVILEDLENQFINEANYQLSLLNDAFADKQSAHTNAVTSETAYETAMGARVAAESAYNNARVNEENAHSTLLAAITDLNDAIQAYDSQYATYQEQIEFLNYELYIIHEIRELLGDSLDYIPVQTVLDLNEHDNSYADFETAYPTLYSSSFSNHRFGGVSDEDRKSKRKGKKQKTQRKAKRKGKKQKPQRKVKGKKKQKAQRKVKGRNQKPQRKVKGKKQKAQRKVKGRNQKTQRKQKTQKKMIKKRRQ